MGYNPRLIPANQLVSTKSGRFFYYRMIEVNRQTIERLLGDCRHACNNGFGTAEPESVKMADSRPGFYLILYYEITLTVYQ